MSDYEANILESQMTYGAIDDHDTLQLMKAASTGIKFSHFNNYVRKSPFSMQEWAGFLHLSPRTLQRYQSDQKRFPSIYSEKILEMMLLLKWGAEVFGDEDNFAVWLNTKSIALGSQKPKELLDNTFGIHLVKDELTRIEHGVLA